MGIRFGRLERTIWHRERVALETEEDIFMIPRGRITVLIREGLTSETGLMVFWVKRGALIETSHATAASILRDL
jgi:hypothetical protein